jgi:cytidine deaminase
MIPWDLSERSGEMKLSSVFSQHPRLAELIPAAKAAAHASYSPYSKFRVGAAVLARDKIFVGCNIENASYGLTICAERVAIFNAIAGGAHVIHALAVSCIDAPISDAPNQRMPCGACLQVIEEFCPPDSIIIVDGMRWFTKKDLLPIPFKLDRNPQV